MKVTLLDSTTMPELFIGEAAAICYDSDTSASACYRRVKSCKESGHLSTLRFASATFRIEGISRICSHQLVRHPHLSYLQRSQRYVLEKAVSFIEPPAVSTFDYNDQLAWADILDKAEELYLRLVREKKMKKEDARFILPQACDTALVVTGNFQAWMDFVNLRSEKHAQWEIRNVALEIKRQLAEIAPLVFGD